MKKFLFYLVIALCVVQVAFAEGTAFDSNEKAVEVKLAPAATTTNTQIQNVDSVHKVTIKEEKFNNALINLDDAQVELRQELSTVSAKYTTALAEKRKAIQNCKLLKKEMSSINRKMKNVEKSKKMINKNLEVQK